MPGLSDFQLLAKHAPYQLYRYAVDWCLQFDDGPLTVRNWESSEPGSIKGVLNAYSFVIPFIKQKKRFELDDIMHIHSLCIKGVIESRLTEPLEELRRGYTVAFGIEPGTCSESGLRALAKEHEKYPYRIQDISVDQSEAERFDCLEQLVKGPEQFFNFFSYNGNLSKEEIDEFEVLASKVDSKGAGFIEDATKVCRVSGGAYMLQVDYALAESLYQMYKPPVRYLELKKKYQLNLTEEIQKILIEAYEIIEAHVSEDEKLTAIVKAIQRLEHLHPFYDGNCRVFCMVILNVLLMQVGFPPTLIDNPNKFDGYSVDELAILIRKGMQRTIKLCDYVAQESSNPTSFDPIDRSRQSPDGDGSPDDSCDDEYYIKPLHHWMEVHPIQRKELNTYASSLVAALGIENQAQSALSQNSLFSASKAINLDKGLSHHESRELNFI